MNRYAKALCDATLTGDRQKIREATQNYMQAAAFAFTRVQNEFACPIEAPLIVVAEVFANSLRLVMSDATRVTVEKLRDLCTVVTIPVPPKEDER